MEREEMPECTCGNLEFGFDCICDFVAAHPGDKEFGCEFCGCYKADQPRCNKCEEYKNKA